MRKVSVNGVELAFEEFGSGSQALLLIHGHPFDHTMWRPQFAPIAHLGWRLIAPDLRGYGSSGGGDGGKTTLETFAHDLAGLLDRLGIGQAVIVGLSMGGQIAMELCRLHPQRVSGLVLASTYPQAETPAGRQHRMATAERVLKEGMHAYAQELLPKMLAPACIAAAPEISRHVLSMMRETPAKGAAAALRGRAERPDYCAVLGRFAHLALVVVGDQDAFTTRQDADRMHGLLKRSRLLWMPGVGHMPNLEQPEAFNAALAEFLGQFAGLEKAQDASLADWDRMIEPTAAASPT